jgi:hypothetical protein
MLREQCLTELVSPRRELVQHLALWNQARFLDPIECARYLDEVGDALPVDGVLRVHPERARRWH